MATTSVATANQDTDSQADAVRQQMRQIRRELGNDVEELVVQAERLMDWHYYIDRYPWAMVGVASLIGYFLVPKRSVAFPTDDKTLARLAERIPVVYKAAPPEAKKPTIVGSLMTMGTNLLMRAAMAYASQQVGKILGHQAANGKAPNEEHQYHG